MDDPFEARAKYRYFRILVIGRANAGKTTLLKRVCNTTEEPCIYDEKSNSLLEPTSGRGIHDIDRPFAFASNPQFIFHDSPGFEAGDESQLKKVQSFLEKRAKSTEVDDQLHAIWFCFIPDKSRFLLDLETRFFNEQRAGNIPVIAIFTKFDDLISQVYDKSKGLADNREAADKLLKDKLRAPLFEYKFPPRADVCLEDMHEDDEDHQEQVKELIKKTAESLDNLALKILFVSLQQNNLELCLQYAVKYAPSLRSSTMEELVEYCLMWFRHSYFESHDYGRTEEEVVGERGEGGVVVRREGGVVRRFVVRREEDGALLQNRKEVMTFMKIKASKVPFMKKKKPSLAIFSALIICLENSFWYQSPSMSFIDAFRKAFGIYTETATKAKLEIALKELGDLSDEEAFRSALFEILLEHRLPHPDDLQPSN